MPPLPHANAALCDLLYSGLEEITSVDAVDLAVRAVQKSVSDRSYLRVPHLLAAAMELFPNDGPAEDRAPFRLLKSMTFCWRFDWSEIEDIARVRGPAKVMDFAAIEIGQRYGTLVGTRMDQGESYIQATTVARARLVQRVEELFQLDIPCTPTALEIFRTMFPKGDCGYKLFASERFGAAKVQKFLRLLCPKHAQQLLSPRIVTSYNMIVHTFCRWRDLPGDLRETIASMAGLGLVRDFNPVNPLPPVYAHALRDFEADDVEVDLLEGTEDDLGVVIDVDDPEIVIEVMDD